MLRCCKCQAPNPQNLANCFACGVPLGQTAAATSATMGAVPNYSSAQMACPGCRHPVSALAPACPACGFPVAAHNPAKQQAKTMWGVWTTLVGLWCFPVSWGAFVALSMVSTGPGANEEQVGQAGMLLVSLSLFIAIPWFIYLLCTKPK